MRTNDTPSDDPRTTFLLVHGSGTSSSMWAPLQRELALRGRRSYAIDLPGHGFDAQYSRGYQSPQDLDALRAERSTLAEITLDDNVEALATAARALRHHGPVILVSASLGGVTTTSLTNEHPELVDGLVYISAWACASKANPIEYMGEPEFEGSLLPGLAGLNIELDPPQLIGRANYRTADPILLGKLKAAVMEEIDDDRFMAFVNLMQPDEALSVMMADARIHPDVWGQVPHTYIRLLRDRSLPLAMQDRLIREADLLTPENPFRVHSLDASHAGFLYHSEQVMEFLTRQ